MTEEVTLEQARAEAKREFAQLAADLEKETAVRVKAEERVRILTILASDEAKGRSDLAMKLALDMDVDAEAAIALLDASPRAESGFGTAMAGLSSSDVGPDGDEPDYVAPQLNISEIYQRRRDAVSGQ